MKKLLKKMIPLLLAMLMLAEMLPLGVMASELDAGRQLEAELAASVGAEEYPEGMFDFLTARMETDENVATAEFAIIRRGNTDQAATVRFKAVDMSAEYGADYTIEVVDGLSASQIEKNEDAPLYISAIDIGEDDIGEVGDAPNVVVSEQEAVQTAEPAEQTDGSAQPLQSGSVASLRDAVRLSTGYDMDAYDWQEDDEQTVLAFQQASAEMYDDIAGHETVLSFAPGEYQKILRFHTVDDSVSEDDEQVLFVLSHAEGCALSENPTGYMNIKDNDPVEEATYAFGAPEYTVARGADSVTIELKRLTGISRYSTVEIGTVAGSATAGNEYEAFTQEVVFVPNQTVKQITVNVRQHPASQSSWFSIKTADYAAETKITIEPSYDTPVYLCNDGITLNGLPTRSSSIFLNTLTKTYSNSSRGRYQDSYFYVNNSSVTFSASATSLDLTMVGQIAFSSGEYGSGTKYTKKSGCSTSTYWKTNKSNYLAVNGTNLFSKAGKYNEVSTTVSLPNQCRTSSASLTFSSLGTDGCNDTDGRLNGWLTLYYEPFFVDCGSWDDDAYIYPLVYTSKNGTPKNQTIRNGSGEEVTYSFKAGTMHLTTGEGTSETSRSFFNNDTIRVEPVYDSSLSDAQKAGIYLWGVKFERTASGAATQYYYLNQTEFSLSKLYRGEYHDYYTGEQINSSCLLKSGDQRGYKILPVFRQKTAYTLALLPDTIDFAAGTFFEDNGSFSTDNLIVTGQLDQIALNTIGTSGLVIQGWNVLSSNGASSVPATNRTWYFDNAMKTGAATKNLCDPLLKNAAAEMKSQYNKYTGKQQSDLTLKTMNYDALIPGTMTYQPTGRWTVLTASTVSPAITVTVSPTPISTELQKKGAVGFEDQVAQYVASQNAFTSVVISPYSIQQYDLLASIPDEVEQQAAAEGKHIKVIWQDYTGDTNRDGDISKAELNAMGAEAKAAYGTLRLSYVGNVFNYLPKLIGQSLVYYQFVAQDDDGYGKNMKLHGSVYLRGNDVNRHSTTNGGYTEMALAGIPVQVGNLKTTTDEDGWWEIASTDFRSGEIYSVSFSYEGRIYSDSVGVNQEKDTYIDEYNTFDVRNFSVKVGGDATTVNCSSADVQDKNMRFSFFVTSAIPGLEPSVVKVVRYRKDGQFAQEYQAYPTCDNEYVIRTADSLSEYRSGTSDYSFNPKKENVLAGDYFKITIYDSQTDIPYITHEVGFKFIAQLRSVNVVNNFLNPITSPVFDFFGKVDMAFDLGLVTSIENAEESGLKAIGIKMEETDKNGVKTKTVSWGWNTSYESKYAPKKSDSSKKDSTEAAKSDAREAASSVETVNKIPSVQQTSAVTAAEMQDPQTDAAKVAKAENAVSEAVDTGKNGKKNRSSFSAGIEVELNLAVSIEMAYDNAADKWYFVEFLVIGKVGTAASASYSYMTPIGIKLGIKASLSGDITAMLGFDPYYKNPGNPDYRYIDDGRGGLFDIMGSNLGNADINREYTVYGKLIIRPTISLSLSASLVSDKLAEVSLTGAAAFDMVFTTGHTGSGSVELSAKLELKLLGGLIKKNWSLADKTFNMFSYSNSLNLMGADDYRYDSITSDDLNQQDYVSSTWLGNRRLLTAAEKENERLLISNLNFDPQPKIERLYEDNVECPDAPQSLVIFLDVKESDPSKLILKYSVLQENLWSEPVAFDPSSNGDDEHSIFWMDDDTLIICWSTYVGDPASTDPAELLNNRELRTVMMDVTETDVIFHDIKELTDHTAGDNSAASDVSIIYYEDDQGDSQMMATYRKSTYTSNGDELLVGDVLNAESAYAFRTYDFVNDEWNSTYDPAYLTSLGLSGQAAEDFSTNFYGQYFPDFYSYAEAENVWMTPEALAEEMPTLSGARGLGVWTKEPNASDVVCRKLTGKVIETQAAHCKLYGNDYALYAYLCDLDSADSTTDDREIFIKVYDLTNNVEYLSFRLTSNALTESNLVLTETRAGYTLYYNSDGSIVSVYLSNIFDTLVTGTTSWNSKTVHYLLENRMADCLIPEVAIIPKIISEDGEGNTDVHSYGAFSMDWSDKYEYIVYTEPIISYADGITSSDPEAALPENQFIEHQIFSKLRYVDPATITTEGGEVSYWKDTWYPYIQVTDDKGLNVLSMDAAANGLLEISCVSVEADSVLQDVDGILTPVPDTEHLRLVVASYDLFSDDLIDYGVEITVDNLDGIYTAEGTYNLEYTVKNPHFSGGEHMSAYIYQQDFNGLYKIIAQDTIGNMDSYQTLHCTTLIPLLEELRGNDLRIVIVNEPDYVWNYNATEYGSLDIPLDPPPMLQIDEAKRTLNDRNHAVYDLRISNPSSYSFEAETASITIGNQVFTSEPFSIDGYGQSFVSVSVSFPESVFTESRENGMIYEKAEAVISISGDSVTDELVRMGPARYESAVQSAYLIDPVTGTAYGSQLHLNLNDKADFSAQSEDGDTLSVVIMDKKGNISSDPSIVSDNKRTTVQYTAMITPNISGYMAVLDGSQQRSAYNDLFTIPSALIKEITLSVDTGNPGGTYSGGGSEPAPKKEEPEQEVQEETFGFIDVHTGDYFAEAVAWAAGNDITTGVSKTVFAPYRSCTRAQIVTFLWRASGSPATNPSAGFTDVDPDSYYAQAVAWAVEKGITKGTSRTTFSPNEVCTRAQAVSFLARLTGGTSSAKPSFTDVPADAYYAEAVSWALENGITSGTSSTKFSPNDTCSRAQIVTFLYRCFAK